MLTLQVQVRCEACNGEGGASRGFWYEHADQRQYLVDRFDCEACGGKGHTMQTITLDDAAIRQIAQAVMTQLPTVTRHAIGKRTM